MGISFRWSVLVVLVAGPLTTAQPPQAASARSPASVDRAKVSSPSLLVDVWNAAYLEGNKAGFVHTTVREIDHNGGKLLRTTTDLELNVKRFQDSIRLRMETGTDETSEGRVKGVFMRQYLGKEQTLVLTGAVEGDELQVKVDGGARQTKTIPWNDRVIGMYRQERLFQEYKIRPGDHFSYLSFEPTINTVVNTQVAVKDYEDVEVLKVKRRLLRVEATPDKITVPGAKFQLPTLISWLDKDLQTVRSQVDMPGLGKLVLYRTTAAIAKAPASDKLPNIGLTSLLPIKQRILQPYDARSAVYRITLRNDDDPATAFAQDSRQHIANVKGNTFELHIDASIGERKTSETAGDEGNEVPAEFLESCYFINCDDAKVKEHASRAVGQEKDPWRKSLRIERYVHDRMDKKNFTEAFATADQVARTMEGDCTEHSMLAAAMCRAAGVPSRTALGLVYVDDRARGPVLGFHMWTEVWIRGQWIPIDATLGRGYVGATHLKITDHSWHDTQSLTPLLPVVRVLGKLSVEVVSVNGMK
jgi:transglutaminase-like putative cysteine protease